MMKLLAFIQYRYLLRFTVPCGCRAQCHNLHRTIIQPPYECSLMFVFSNNNIMVKQFCFKILLKLPVPTRPPEKRIYVV